MVEGLMTRGHMVGGEVSTFVNFLAFKEEARTVQRMSEMSGEIFQLIVREG
jgi:riboflavin synthase alpha subunit